MKWRKLSGTYYRTENGKKICYQRGSVIEATEEELRHCDPLLATWQRAEDTAKPTGSADGTQTKEQIRFVMEQQSKILHPERMALGTMYSAMDELYIRETRDRNAHGEPIGLLVKAKSQLQEAIKNWHYNNDTQPVKVRSDGPPQSAEILRCEATIELLEKEITALKTRLKPELEHRDADAKQIAARKKRHAEENAYHPAYAKNKDALAVREKMSKTPVKMTRRVSA